MPLYGKGGGLDPVPGRAFFLAASVALVMFVSMSDMIWLDDGWMMFGVH